MDPTRPTVPGAHPIGAMQRTLRLAPALATLAAIYAACVAAAVTALPRHPAVGPALAFDLTVTAGVAFWWLAVRPGHVRPRALALVVVLGLGVARQLGGLRGLGAVTVAIDVAVMAWLVLRVRRIARTTRARRAAGDGLPAALDAGFAAVLPVRAVAAALAGEVAAVILALTGWWRRPPEGHSMHRRSGYLLFFGVIVALAVVETAGAHVMLSRWSPTAAWIVTGLSIYGLLWLVGDAHAVRLAPARVIDGALVLEKGVRWRVRVPLADVASVTAIDAKQPDALDLSLLGPNLLVTLARPVTAYGPFGIRRTISTISVSMDDPDAFCAAVGAPVTAPRSGRPG